MFCPRCTCEYREGFTTCADCDVRLVAELPSDPTPDACFETSQSDLVPVFETYNQTDILIIKSALTAAGIIFHFSGENFHMMGVMPTSARLLVASDRKEEVFAILRDLEFIQ